MFSRQPNRKYGFKKLLTISLTLILVIGLTVFPLTGVEDSHTITNTASLTSCSFTASTITTEYPKGTRGLVAASLLLSYYDSEYNGDILNGNYSTAITAYDYLLTQADFEANGGTYPRNDAAAVNELLSVDLNQASFGAKAFWGAASTETVVSKLGNDEPVVLYLTDGSIVVAYAFSIDAGVTTFTVHTATKDEQGNAIYGTTVNASEVKSVLWLNTISSHTHTMKYTGSDADKHYQSCTNPNCAVHNEASHSFTCTYANGQHVMTCSCGIFFNVVNHEYNTATCTQPGMS